jgi:tetratricopeptide (TPR) repeat protein
MDTASEQPGNNAEDAVESGRASARRLVVALCACALVFAFVAGLRTITEYDLWWQLATGRWVAQHHQIPSVDVLSYTAQGRPWIYPIGSPLIFYGVYLAGGYGLLSLLGAAVCIGAIALLLRRGSAVSAALAILAVPLIAARTTPRSDMFTVLLFAAFLSLLWQQHETGRARLWLLPVLMAAWVNLHLGLAAGLALVGGYALLEGLELPWPERRRGAADRLLRSWPWLLATFAATLVNPWGWRIYLSMLGFMAPMSDRSHLIAEWAPANLSWTRIVAGLSPRHPDFFLLLLIIAAVAILIALYRRQLGAALLLGGAATLGVRHLRFQALFSIIVVVVAGAVLTSAARSLHGLVKEARTRSTLAIGAGCIVAALAGIWSVDLVSDRSYLQSTSLASFGAGVSWWFPERAAAFIQREKIPGQVFNNYNEGGYIAWRLGPERHDYVDGRGDPFGSELIRRSILLMGSAPDSPEWRREAELYDINAIIVPLGRYDALQFFPLLRQFCASETWKPVYLDEVSAVFVRRQPATEDLIRRLQIDCQTAALPAAVAARTNSAAFNQWANAAAVLMALGRTSEALAATSQALAIFPDSAYVHFTRANALEQLGNQREAEQHYLLAAALEPHAVSWARVAKLYEREGRWDEAIPAWERVADLATDSHTALLSLGYDELAARRPQEALNAFRRAGKSVEANRADGFGVDASFDANLAHGRAEAWRALGDFKQAIAFGEEAARLMPGNPDVWFALADLYSGGGRVEDAQRARDRAVELKEGAFSPRAQ